MRCAVCHSPAVFNVTTSTPSRQYATEAACMAHLIETLTHITTVGMAARVVLVAVHDHPEPESATVLAGQEALL